MQFPYLILRSALPSSLTSNSGIFGKPCEPGPMHIRLHSISNLGAKCLKLCIVFEINAIQEANLRNGNLTKHEQKQKGKEIMLAPR